MEPNKNLVSGKMKKMIGHIGLVFFCFSGMACKKPYLPPVINTSNSFLVVEGVINTGNDSTFIHLSRTVPLSSTLKSIPETGSVVTIITDAGTTYPVMEKGNGDYSATAISAKTNSKYALKIITANGKAYQSDFISGKNSPPIDSVYYKVTGSGVNVYADTHDPANNSKYYRWEYIETYEYHSAFHSYDSLATMPKDTVLMRHFGSQIYQCWQSDTSTSIILNSSAKLTTDIINQNQVAFIPSTSEKIAGRYSILVKQYAMTPEAYNYYQILQKNTEKLGTIFDAQPSELPGNVHCLSDPNEVVIGYITAGAVAQGRIFVDNRDLPDWQSDNPYASCHLDTDVFVRAIVGTKATENEVKEYIYTGIHYPVADVINPISRLVIGYSASLPFCVECTVRGTNVRPKFWTDY